ncbi:MAG: 2-C-methyl-D-erythritol 2,4-cyclodiphosphate synthase [Nitrospinae bacterium RIFCSPLOWO2_12_FULL_45_22]|nr:MAG: 2-C-methyl-D-erythritol 2,4-cyclodiphosphate synthase [Nitrospinae bacterium RIFCSPLOWO2_12_FULL_45_22]
MFRIGYGYDIHPLEAGRKLILGGIEIPFQKGLAGHSDADVLVHAICDALLGAIGQGDIGLHFPPTSPEYKDISSLKLLEKVIRWVKEKGFVVGNLDSTIVAQKPQISPYFEAMKQTLAPIMELALDRANIKAKTPEGLGPIGHGEGIAAYAVVILMRKNASQSL